MQEEISELLKEMIIEKVFDQGKRRFHVGTLYGVSVVLVFSRWGKVASATTVTQLIVDFKVDKIVFTGIAGGLADSLNIGDIVVGKRFFQHDMDARPMMAQYEIPLVEKTYFESNKTDLVAAEIVIEQFLSSSSEFLLSLRELGIENPKLHVGDIASGDLFVSSDLQKQAILIGIPSVLCVEMEGAAVAQVCYDFDVPLLVIRSISDTADHKAHVDFPVYLEKVAAVYAHHIFKRLLPRLV